MYEPFYLEYTIPASKHKYTPDFIPLSGSTHVIEVKGKLDRETRKKMLLVKEQHPAFQFCFIFGRASNKLSKNSKTTYGDWASANGFKWIDVKDPVPKEWLDGHKSRN